MKEGHRPVGFFDSGVGGISVMKEAAKLLPNENFIYFGDSKNAPYGVKSVEDVRKLSLKAFEFLAGKNVKAVVVACNTATSAAIEDLRKKYKEMPVIGIEPALKPAVEFHRNGSIVIMATPMTLAEKKFKNLMKKYGRDSEIVPLPCPGLVEFVENGITDGPEIEKYLYGRLEQFLPAGVSAVVLGCTHYPFIKNSLKKILGKETPIIDGSAGTSKQLKRELERCGLLNESGNGGKVEIYNSSDDSAIIELSYKLFKL